MLSRETLFTLRQLCELWFGPDWQIHYCTVRRWFFPASGQLEPGVIVAGTGKKNKHLLIPEPVAERVYNRRMARRVA